MAPKLFGLVFLCLAGAMIGGSKALQLSERVNILTALHEAVTVFENEIYFKTVPVYEAFESAAKRDLSGVFSASIPYIFEKGATRAFEDSVKSLNFSEEEREALISFAKGLSAEDKEGQIKNAQITILRIKEIEKHAVSRREKLFSLYCSIGVLGGAAGGIMLL